MTPSVHFLLLAGLALLPASLAAQTVDPRPQGEDAAATGYQPLRPIGRCLIPERARDWAYVADDEILVDAGRRKYRIRFSYGCPALAFGNFIRFEPGPGIGRMCGHLNERVAVDGGHCHVSRVEEIDKATWREELRRPGVTLFRHIHDHDGSPFLVDRKRSEFDAGRSR